MEIGEHTVTEAGAASSEEGSIENVYDVPFVTVTRVDGEYVAEIVLSGDPVTDEDRIREALRAAAPYGVQEYGRVYSDLGVEEGYQTVMIYLDTPVVGGSWEN